MSKRSISKRQNRRLLKELAALRTQIALQSPFSADLARLVDRAYALFGVDHVSTGLEVCMCNVCMSDETRREIIATPNRIMAPWMICEYTNSAHGLPVDVNDLRILLPRYMELLARGEAICNMYSDDALWRFGEARLEEEFLSKEEIALVDKWGRALMLHYAWADATDQDTTVFLWEAARLMLSLALDGAVVIEGIEAAFSQPDTGPVSIANFTLMLEDRNKPPEKTFGDFLRKRSLRPDAVEAVIDWIESDRFAAWRDRARAAGTLP
ncbi:MAG: hypothetical protein ACK5MQ_15895 [Pikeienuella sp.]